MGHHQREPRDGYIQTLREGRNQISDPRTARLYDKLVVIIRGNLWTRQRWKAIWALNTGQFWRDSGQNQTAQK